MDSISLCWRGMAGTGKKEKLHDALRGVASLRGIPFTIQTKGLDTGTTSGDVAEAGATESGAGPDSAESGQFMMEHSLVHIGLDIARMSMQDKHILRPILAKLGQGSQVLAGNQGRGARIVVLYHAHLLSSESVILLQACLEQNEGDLSIWMTSELPAPQRIRDWFVEISVAGDDRNFSLYKAAVSTVSDRPANWPDVFRGLIDVWRKRPAPTIQDVKEVKAFVYDMLMRNLRWVEATHFLLDVILSHTSLEESQRRAAIHALGACEATGGGYTIPSYRIPILWESLFLQIRNIFSNVSVAEVDAPPRTGRTGGKRKKGVGTSTTTVVA